MAKQTIKSKVCLFLVFILAGSLLLASCKTPEVQTTGIEYSVIFQDYDGTVLSTQKVVSGQSASAPTDPQREGYTFAGWDENYNCVTEDLTIIAQYTWIESPSIMVVSMTAKPGQDIKVPVTVVNNPGVAGAKITMIYDPALMLIDSESGEAFSVLDHTKPGKYMSPCSFTWDSEIGMAENDGHILWLTFKIPSDAAPGKSYAVNCICKDGDFFDEDLNDILFEAINGVITVQ